MTNKISSSLHELYGADFPWKWEVCNMCGPTIICPKCGLNVCSSGIGEIDGQPCDVCPLARAACQKAYDEGTVPELPGGSLKERLEELKRTRAKLEADGVRFGTREDLDSI